MKNNVSLAEERQFITKEFADTLAGKNPAPYLRVHDPAQQALVALAEYDLKNGGPVGLRPYLDRMIHFWREISVAGFPCAGRDMDECYALLFESVFSLAQSKPEWASACLANNVSEDVHLNALRHFAHQVKASTVGHTDIVNAFTHLYAPRREESDKWQNPVNVALAGELWFWAAVALSVGTHDNDGYGSFQRAIIDSAAANWHDGNRLHIRLIREAPLRAPVSAGAELMAHPLIRLARIKYREGSVEQTQLLRFLNRQCIRAGIESEEEFFGSDLTLAQWARDARAWAVELRESERDVYDALMEEVGQGVLEQTERFYVRELGESPELIDDLDTTAVLMRWAKRRRGFELSRYRAELWEFVVEIVDAALWLGWLFPRKWKSKATLPDSGCPTGRVRLREQ